MGTIDANWSMVQPGGTDMGWQDCAVTDSTTLVAYDADLLLPAPEML